MRDSWGGGESMGYETFWSDKTGYRIAKSFNFANKNIVISQLEFNGTDYFGQTFTGHGILKPLPTPPNWAKILYLLRK